MYVHLHVRYLLFLSDLNETWIFLTYFRKILKCQILRKSVQWEPSYSMLMDGHDESNSRFLFCNFPSAPKREKEPYSYINMSSLCFWDTALCHWWHQSPSWNYAVSKEHRNLNSSTRKSKNSHILMFLFNLMDPHVYEYAQQELIFQYSFFQIVNYARIGSVKTVLRYCLPIQSSPKV